MVSRICCRFVYTLAELSYVGALRTRSWKLKNYYIAAAQPSRRHDFTTHLRQIFISLFWHTVIMYEESFRVTWIFSYQVIRRRFVYFTVCFVLRRPRMIGRTDMCDRERRIVKLYVSCGVRRVFLSDARLVFFSKSWYKVFKDLCLFSLVSLQVRLICRRTHLCSKSGLN